MFALNTGDSMQLTPDGTSPALEELYESLNSVLESLFFVKRVTWYYPPRLPSVNEKQNG